MKNKNRKKGLTPFGKAVRKKTIDKGMTLTQLAQQAGTNSSYLGYIMRGQRSGEKYIRKIGEILNIDIHKYIA